ncbi:RTA1-domain-containing protein [Tothia fuscella]|uniref:RTA1-domain-containing protein n=1 Tax=Tothia fuscella TaxID=1048955 RepID=A0A9P4U2B5_9PEZI|nr:RTA1-domain-containing protein [Tothia fuscella]
MLSYWSYRPSVPINATFIAMFVIFTIVGLSLGFWTRRFKKYTAVMFIGNVMQIIGYVARMYAYNYPFSDLSFITQLTCLTLAPAFYAAGIYFSLAQIVLIFGGQNSRVPPALIPKIFITCDIISLILQGGGGALAAWYAQHEKMPDNGNYTMIGGLSFQALTLLIFLGMAGDFAWRTSKAKKLHGDSAMNEDLSARRLRRSKKFQYLLVSLAVSAVLIFFRSVYRVMELSEGWKGHLMSNEKYVVFFESIPVAVAALLQSAIHPGHSFRESEPVDIRFTDMPPTPENREPIHTIRRWNEKTGKCEVELIYDDSHPVLSRNR